MSETLRALLPRVYEGLLPSFFDSIAPEEPIYRKAFELVSGLSQGEALRIVGANEELGALEAAYERLRAPVLPERLRLELYREPVAAEDGVVVATYSPYEPIKLTPALFEVLRELRPDEKVADFRARMLRDHDLDVPEDMLRSCIGSACS